MDVNSLSHTKWNCKYHIVLSAIDSVINEIYHYTYNLLIVDSTNFIVPFLSIVNFPFSSALVNT